MSSSPDRSRNAGKRRDKARDQRLGHWAESFAAWSLMLKGYRIIDRRYAAAGGEIDLVARRRDLIIFVEVKARADVERARAAINGFKIERISRAARAWVSRRDGEAQARLNHSYRVDAVLVAPWRWPQHVEDIATIEGL
jgi:putative endonuclease